MSDEVTVFPCRTCEGTGQEKIYFKIKRCAGCGYGPLDLSASTCPRCHRSKYNAVTLHDTDYNTRQCRTCWGHGRMILITGTKPGMFFGSYRTFRNVIGSPMNIAKYAPHLALGSGFGASTVVQTNTNTQLLNNLGTLIANAAKAASQPTKYHYYDGKDRYQGTVDQIIAVIKKNPSGRHQIYFDGEWCDASNLKPFNQHTAKKSRKKTTTQTKGKKKNTQTRGKTGASTSKKKTQKKAEKPKPKLTYPRKEQKYQALCKGLSAVYMRFPEVPQTKKMISALNKLFKEWDNGIEITKRSQPTLDRAINAIYALPERYLLLVLDELEAIETNKHLVSKQRKSSFQPPPEEDDSHFIYPSSNETWHPLYSALEETREHFRELGWPGKTGVLGDKIDAFLEKWSEDGIDPTKKSHGRLDDIVTTIYSLRDYLLVMVITHLEAIEEHKHTIVKQPKKHSTKRSTAPSRQSKTHAKKREQFSARTLHEEIMEGNNGWLLEFPSSLFQTDNDKWNESRIGVVAKVLREHDSRVSFDLLLKWCQKYGQSDEVMLPILGKKKMMEGLFEDIWRTGQFNEKEYQGELFLKGSTELIKLKAP